MSILPRHIRVKLHTIIYESDTKAGRLFDLVLLALILISVFAVILESVASVQAKYGFELTVVEWVITIFFTVEYIGRIVAVPRPWKYITSFYGIVDLLSMLPAYVGFFYPSFHFLLSLRAIRLLRVFRILKLMHFVGASNMLVIALNRSRTKIAVFIFTVIVICVMAGTVMFVVEGPENGFENIPIGIYWTVVTLTTVGFGDITPQTPLGQFISTLIMIMGYGIIAVPTGIVTSEIARSRIAHTNTQVCPECQEDDHTDGAKYCHSCGNLLNPKHD